MCCYNDNNTNKKVPLLSVLPLHLPRHSFVPQGSKTVHLTCNLEKSNLVQNEDAHHTILLILLPATPTLLITNTVHLF